LGSHALPFILLVSQSGLPAYALTRLGRYELPLFLIVIPSSLPAYALTRLGRFHFVSSQSRII